METQSSLKFLIIGITAFLGGAIVGMFTDPYLPAPLSNTKKGYQFGFTAAQTLVENSSVGSFFRTPNDVRILSGTVTAISGDSFTVHLQSVNPFDDPSLADRTVIVNASTTVTRLVPVDPKVFQTEMNSFMVTTQGTATNTKAPPASFTTVVANEADIKVGDSVNVSASGNIKTLKEFIASDINILLKTSAP